MKCGKGKVIDPDVKLKEVRFCYIDTEDGTHVGEHKTIYQGKVLTWSQEQSKLQI